MTVVSRSVLRGKAIVFICKNTRWANARQPGVVFFPQLIAQELTRENAVLWIGGMSRRPTAVITAIKSPKFENPAIRTPFVTGKGFHQLGTIDAELYARQIRRFMQVQKVKDPLYWAVHVGCPELVDRLPEGRWVYSVGDEFSWAREQRFLGLADAVLTLSERTHEVLVQHHAAKTLLYSTGVDFDRWTSIASRSEEEPPDLARVPRPRVGFVGHVTLQRVDFELLSSVARSLPGASVVLIGTVSYPGGAAELRRHYFSGLGNVHLLGSKAYEELPLYVRGLDVGLIPYLETEFNLGSSPNKVYEYFAFGKPVVTTFVPALGKWRPLLRVASNAGSFVHAVHDELSCKANETLSRRRLEVARNHSVRAVADRIDGFFGSLGWE